MPIVDIHDAEIGIYSLSGDTRQPLANVEFDLNQFRDPLGNLHLRKSCVDGKDPLVQDWIKVDPRYGPLLNQIIILAKDHEKSGGKWLSFGFRDHHGTWISRSIAMLVATELASLGFKVGVMHAKGQD